ncbi:MAG: hypothetical protein ACI8ZN_001290 [Bacteroidia bacterium]|jgi:uncharacterized protein
MGNRIHIALVLFFLGLNLVQAQVVKPPHEGNRAFVMDDAGVLSDEEERILYTLAKNEFDSSSNQFVIYIEERTGSKGEFNRSIEIANAWGIGEKEKSNGVLIYVATIDRKVYIQVGRGLEGAIPDMYAAKVIRELIVPNFKAKGYFQGLKLGLEELIAYSNGEYSNTRKVKNGLPTWIIILIIIIILIVITSFGDNSGKTYHGRRRSSPWLGAGGFGGYSGGGGGGGGGGFGGFGGGSFGGGGAGGSW